MAANIYIALGSNVGDSRAFIERAIALLGEQVVSIKRAPIYSSKAVGYTDQPDFFNTVIQGRTTLEPQKLLAFVKQVEERVGRIKRFRWGPREVDIDIIFYGDQIVDEPGLHIPHKEFAKRDFVLGPLCDLNPNFIDPRSGQKISALYQQLPPQDYSILRT